MMLEVQNTQPRSRILCTEDDADTRELLRVLLERQGFSEAMAAGAQGYLVKPADPAKLIATVRDLIHLDGDQTMSQSS